MVVVVDVVVIVITIVVVIIIVVIVIIIIVVIMVADVVVVIVECVSGLTRVGSPSTTLPPRRRNTQRCYERLQDPRGPRLDPV